MIYGMFANYLVFFFLDPTGIESTNSGSCQATQELNILNQRLWITGLIENCYPKFIGAYLWRQTPPVLPGGPANKLT